MVRWFDGSLVRWMLGKFNGSECSLYFARMNLTKGLFVYQHILMHNFIMHMSSASWYTPGPTREICEGRQRDGWDSLPEVRGKS